MGWDGEAARGNKTRRWAGPPAGSGSKAFPQNCVAEAVELAVITLAYFDAEGPPPPPPPPPRDSLSVFRKRETLCEAKSMFNAERIIDTCFDHDWNMMQREKGEEALLTYIHLKPDAAGFGKLARCAFACLACCPAFCTGRN